MILLNACVSLLISIGNDLIIKERNNHVDHTIAEQRRAEKSIALIYRGGEV